MRINTYFVGSIALLLAAVIRPLHGSEATIRSLMASELRRSTPANRVDVDDHGQQRALQSWYAGPNPAPHWIRDGRPTAQAAALVRELSLAADHGLLPADYHAQDLAEWLEQLRASGAQAASDELAARFEVMLSRGALRFLNDLHFGRIDPAVAG